MYNVVKDEREDNNQADSLGTHFNLLVMTRPDLIIMKPTHKVDDQH